MKYLLLLLLPFAALANEITVDPTLDGQKTLTVTCTYPTEREDNTPLSAQEIAKTKFYVSPSSTNSVEPAGENTEACRQVYDLTNVADDTYSYFATTVDTDGRESMYSDPVVLTVKRQANPNAPTGVSGSVN